MTGHTLIIGTGGTGKSTFAKHLVTAYVSRKRKVFVLDQPMTAHQWKGLGAEVDTNRALFLAKIKRHKSATLVIDESGSTIEKSDDANWLTTTARHYGHCTIIIAHRHTQLQPVLRENCDRLVLFNASKTTRIVLSDEWGLDTPIDSLPSYYFWLLERGRKPILGMVTKQGIELGVKVPATIQVNEVA